MISSSRDLMAWSEPPQSLTWPKVILDVGIQEWDADSSLGAKRWTLV